MSKLLTAAVAGFVIFAAVSYVFYEILMVEQFAVWEAETARAEPLMLPALFAVALLMFLMAYMYPMGYAGGVPLVEGARFGLMIGGILAAVVLIIYSAFEFVAAGTMTDIVFNVALLTAIGAVIGKIYGEGAAAAD